MADLATAEGNAEALFADLVVAQKDISFQDMQSIARAFRDLSTVEVGRSDDTHDVILGQAARHVIVHAGGHVDTRMTWPISAASPRRLKQVIAVGEQIAFEPEEVRVLAASMTRYIEALVASIAAAFERAGAASESA